MTELEPPPRFSGIDLPDSTYAGRARDCRRSEGAGVSRSGRFDELNGDFAGPVPMPGRLDSSPMAKSTSKWTSTSRGVRAALRSPLGAPDGTIQTVFDQWGRGHSYRAGRDSRDGRCGVKSLSLHSTVRDPQYFRLATRGPSFPFRVRPESGAPAIPRRGRTTPAETGRGGHLEW